MTVRQLIEKLIKLDPEWNCVGTRSGSIEVWSPLGWRYGWVFFDDRATKILKRRVAP